jgi:hypothetical protein
VFEDSLYRWSGTPYWLALGSLAETIPALAKAKKQPDVAPFAVAWHSISDALLSSYSSQLVRVKFAEPEYREKARDWVQQVSWFTLGGKWVQRDWCINAHFRNHVERIKIDGTRPLASASHWTFCHAGGCRQFALWDDPSNCDTLRAIVLPVRQAVA